MNNNGGTAMSELSEAKAKSRDRAARRKLEAVPAPLPAMTIPVSSRGNGSLLELIEPTKPLRRIILDAISQETVDEIVEEWRCRAELSKVRQRPSRSLALLGRPGWGKSCLVTAIAAELGVPCYRVIHGSLFVSYMGDTGRNLQQIADAVKGRDCVLLIDEFDSVALSRVDGGDATSCSGEMRRVVNGLLQSIDDMGANSHALLALATNSPRSIDKAVWRRIEHVVRLGPCDDEYWDDHWRLACRVFRETLDPQISDAFVSHQETMAEGLRKIQASPAESEQLANQLNRWGWLNVGAKKPRGVAEYWGKLMERMQTRRQVTGC